MFYAELYQSGGCDYTIECGTSVISLAATDHAAALLELEEFLEEHHQGDSISSITLYEVSQTHSVDVKALHKKIKAKRDEARQAAKTASEHAEYLRLQKKFGS